MDDAFHFDAGSRKQEISDSPSGLSVKLHWEGVSLPSPMATVETPAFRPGSQASRRPEGRGFKPELVLRSREQKDGIYG